MSKDISKVAVVDVPIGMKTLSDRAIEIVITALRGNRDADDALVELKSLQRNALTLSSIMHDVSRNPSHEYQEEASQALDKCGACMGYIDGLTDLLFREIEIRQACSGTLHFADEMIAHW